jgi:hypothetical protein
MRRQNLGETEAVGRAKRTLAPFLQMSASISALYRGNRRYFKLPEYNGCEVSIYGDESRCV